MFLPNLGVAGQSYVTDIQTGDASEIVVITFSPSITVFSPHIC